MRRPILLLLPLLLASLLLAACGDDDKPKATPPANNSAAEDAGAEDASPDDTSVEDAAPEDAGADVPEDTGPRPEPGAPVGIDLRPWLGPGPNPAATARVFESASPDDLVPGEALLGRVGDWVMENDRVRVVIERDERVIGPCPYGGNIIDGATKRDGAVTGQDVIGEICMLINAGRTLKPERFEVIADGSDGGAAVLAVTGRLVLLDFINVLGLASTFIDIENLNIGLNPDAELPITATVYYILRGGDQGVKVVTALRNDGDATLHFPVAHLMDSGGVVEFYNPTSSLKGFGYEGGVGGITQIAGEKTIFLGFQGQEGGHLVAFDPDPALSSALPQSGVYLAVAGVAVHVKGISNLANTLLANEAQLERTPGLAHMQPGHVEVFGYWHMIGDGSLATMVDPAYRELGVETGTVEGVVRQGGAPVAGLRVSAISADERAMNQARTDAEGRFVMQVPPGTYTVRAHGDGHSGAPAQVTVSAGATANAALDVAAPATLRVRVQDPAGQATPAKVVLFCEGTCPQVLTPQDRDVTFDPQVDGSWVTIFTGVDGVATFRAPAGSYRIAVSRGPEWSLWPADAKDSGGAPVTLTAGGEEEVTAEIAHVVATPGWVSADLHVHGINSPDSPVALADRVRTFLAEGVDVLVATDHDYITDYTPTIEALGADTWLSSVIGEEITTFDYGHYNAFPMDIDPAQRNAGAVDWAGGDGDGLTPAQIFAAVRAQGGDRVMQVNHPSSGYFGALEIDTLRGTSTANPRKFRLPATTPDPVTGDTGLWDEGFTALEIYNGYSLTSFWRIAKWWMAAISRGFTPTATAVSDTHKRIKDQAGGPRSYVYLGEGADTPDTFAQAPFAQAINAGRLFGTNGPLFTVQARVAGQEVASTLGDTLSATPGQEVTLEVTVEVPTWMSVTAVDVFSNLPQEALDFGNNEPTTAPLTPTRSVPVTFTEADRVVVATGAQEHAIYRKTVSWTMTFDADAWVILVVRGSGDMFPVVHSDVAPFAYANPIYVDVDGGGYNNPPLAAAAQQKRARPPVAPAAPQAPRDLDASTLDRLLHAIEEAHGHNHED